MSRRRRRSTEEVSLNLAAMLDMAFQLLAFFVLTYRPSPVEGRLALNLPPARPATAIAEGNPNQAFSAVPAGEELKTLVVRVLSDQQGSITGVVMPPGGPVFAGGAVAQNLGRLDFVLKQTLGSGSPVEQVVIEVAPSTRYEELMKIIDVCLRQKLANGERLQKISFSELATNSGG